MASPAGPRVGLNLHIYPTTFRHESRILKETESLVQSGTVGDVRIAAVWDEGLPEHEVIDGRRHVWRVRLWCGANPSSPALKALRLIEFQFRVIAAYVRAPVDVVNSHLLSVLPAGVVLRVLRGARLVYDTHELETETLGAGGLRKRLAKLVERTLIPFCDAIITVNQSITRWYENTYRLTNVYTVRNVPRRVTGGRAARPSTLRRDLGIPDDELVFLYQGLLGEGRGIDVLLDVFSRTSARRHLVLMGFGGREAQIREKGRTHPNIHFHPAVQPDLVHDYTQSADVGLCLIENVCMSFYLSLPNKLFEYVMAGLPVIVSDFPEMRRVIEEGGCGWPVPVDAEALFTLIDGLSSDEIRARRDAALLYRSTIGWEDEEAALVRLYQALPLRARQALGPSVH